MISEFHLYVLCITVAVSFVFIVGIILFINSAFKARIDENNARIRELEEKEKTKKCNDD